MRLFRFFGFSCIFLFFTQFLCSTETEIQKSQQALQSDEIYTILSENSFNPTIQLLENTKSKKFPYNILVTNTPSESPLDKKLVIVFPQEIVIEYIPQIMSFLEIVQKLPHNYFIDVLFSANDIPMQEVDSYSFAGSKTYINSLSSKENVASVIISPETLTSFTSNITLFEDIVRISPSGLLSDNKNKLVNLGFFSTIINSMAKAKVSYYMEGVLLSFHRLNLIKGDPLVGVWLENEIPTLAVDINKTNNHKIFSMLNLLLEEFTENDFTEIDVNYGFFEFFSHTFFMSETMYLVLFLIAAATVLFIFCHISFLKGPHKNIHKKELSRTWYLFPLLLVFTTLLLFLSQLIVNAITGNSPNLGFFSLIAKLILTILFLVLLSSLRYLVKMPITGFIYAYMLSISAAFNVLLFSLVEITLMPLFITQYIIIQASQKARKVGPIIISCILMLFPFLPFIMNFANSNAILQLSDVINANIGTNLLISFFMLPFLIMVIRILIRMKVWTTHLKFKRKNFIIKICIVIALIILFTVFCFSYVQFSKNELVITENENITLDSFEIELNAREQFGNTAHSLNINTGENINRYIIEIESTNPIPIYSANYPFDIMQKPLTAVFVLDENPPNPLQLEFLTNGKEELTCTITALINTSTGLQEITFDQIIEAQK